MQFDLEKVYFEVTGNEEAPPVLLLHGWGSSAALMQSIAKGLSDSFRVYNIDLPGHGNTPPPPVPWGVPEYARLVEAFLKAHHLKQVPLIGHSNGGRIGLYMATTPSLKDYFSKLILVSPSGVKPLNRSASFYVRKYTAKILKFPFQFLPRFWRDPALHWLRNTPLWRLLGSSDYQQATGVMRETFVKTVSFYVDTDLPKVTVPTLLFWGTKDTAVSKEQMKVLATKIPDAALIELPDAGHFGYLEQPALFLQATKNFLTA